MREIPEQETSCPVCGNVHGREEQPAYALRCGTILHGKYLIGKTMGQGGFGITYVGFDMVLNMKVAVKEYFPMNMASRENSQAGSVVWRTSVADRESRENGYNSFLKEARKMAKVDAIPAVVSVRDMFLENETAYIIMSFVEGETLKAKLMREGPMAYSDCVRLLMPVMDAMERVHRFGLIHRDISPDNIMIEPDGSVKLLDLGAAKEFDLSQVGEAASQSSQLVTKRGFSPLEQYMDSGKIGTWTDVYAFSAMIYYCTTGKLLPSAVDRLQDDRITFPEHMKEPLSEQTVHTLTRGLALRPENRIRTVGELKAGLIGNPKKENQGTEEKQKEENVQKLPKRKPKRKKRRRWLIPAAIFFGLFVFLLAPDSEDSSSPVTPEETADVNAEESSSPDFQYRIESGEAVILGCAYGTESLSIPETIEGVPVTRIEEKAFEGRDIESVEFPENLRVIGKYAFADCRILKNVIIKEGLQKIEDGAFSGCTGLTSIAFPETLTTIGAFAFAEAGLDSVFLPGHVEEIGGGAFENMGMDFHAFEIDPENPFFSISRTDYGAILFTKDYKTLVSCPSGYGYQQDGSVVAINFADGMGVETIGEGAFSGCSWIGGITLPDTVGKIGPEAFLNCERLTELVIPESVKEIDGGIVAGCDQLKEVTISQDCWCSSEAFDEWTGEVNYYSSYLEEGKTEEGLLYRLEESGAVICGYEGTDTEITIPEELEGLPVTEIGEKAFLGLGIEKVSLPESLRVIGNSAFCYSELKSVYLPGQVESIGFYAFACIDEEFTGFEVDPENPYLSIDTQGNLYSKDYKTLFVCPAGRQNVFKLFDGIERIETGAFFGCTKLEEVILSSTVKSVGSWAFASCSNLRTLVIPESVQSLEGHVLDGCGNLQTVTISADCQFGEDTFEGYSGNVEYY